jgi:tetratricopeptide (TPR) repeat protein
MEEGLLDSWKEISEYLKRKIRTCQYWEKKHGLPVHRLENSPKARVFAYKRELDGWMQKMLHEVEPAAKSAIHPFPLKKKILTLSVLALCALTVIVLIVWHPYRAKEIVRLPSSKPTVVILPFFNNSGDERLDHLSLALSDMLIADLSQSRYISVLRRDRVFSILLELGLGRAKSFSSKNLSQIARHAEATHIIQGSYIRLGELYRMDVDIKESPAMESRGIEKVEGTESGLSSIIDVLTKKIKARLHLTDEAIAHDIDERVGKVTTNSREAYRLYIEGRNLHNVNAYDQSIASMERALDIDPEFALAYKSISESYRNLGLLARSREYAKKALEHSDRISERERYHLQIQFFVSSEKTWGDALGAGTKLIRLYPDDLGGNDLATLYLQLEQWDTAIQYFQNFVQNQEISCFPYLGIVSAYEAKGMYDKAADVLTQYLDDISEHPSIRRQLAFLFLCQGRSGPALDVAKKLDPWNSELKGNIFHCGGEWDKAEWEYLNLLDSRISRDVAAARRFIGSLDLLRGQYDDAKGQMSRAIAYADMIGETSWKHESHSDMAYMDLVSGNPKKALEENSAALGYAVDGESIRRQVDSLHQRGLIFVKMKSLDEARRTADELKTLVESWLNPKLMRYYHHLKGWIELEKGNLPEAIGDLKKALAYLPYQHYDSYLRIPADQALFSASLAAAYYRSGDLGLAREKYQDVVGLTIAKLSSGDLVSHGWFMLARICEQTGRREEAIGHYEKFLDLSKDADAGIPEVAEAQRRLALLRAMNMQ